MLRLLILLLVGYTFFIPVIHNLETVEFTTTGQGRFTKVIEKGVVLSGKSSLLFSVKSCKAAIIVLSDTLIIGNTTGHYFLVRLGSNNNMMVIVEDSCFDCSRINMTQVSVLDCEKYKDFWVRWDRDGHFEVGRGTTLGVDTLASIKGSMGDYNLHVASITSTNQVTAKWHFTAEKSETTFFLPTPGGSTKVVVSELAPVGYKVLNISIKPPNEEITLNLAGDSADMFKIENKTLMVAKQLDYEDKQFHTLTIGTNIGLATSMTVVVRDAIDERPEVNIHGVIVVPEELPIGTVIGWNMTVSDADRSDTLTYRLEGELSNMLTVLPNGNLRILERIDREKLTKNDVVRRASLVVSDSASNTVMVDVEIKVTDINDNRPKFKESLYKVQVMENTTADVSVLKLNYWDPDEGGSGQVNISMVDNKYSSSFYLKDAELFLKAGQLDFETLDTHIIPVIIEAVDQPETGAQLTSTGVVLVQILPRDEFKPYWISPVVREKNVFKSIVIDKSSPSGTGVTWFRIKDEDLGESESYQITTEGVTGFDLNEHTGELTTRGELQKTVYTITVSAKSGKRVVTGKLTIRVGTASQTEDETRLKFDKQVYLIPEPSQDNSGEGLVEGTVVTPDKSYKVSISMDEDDQEVYLLETHGNAWMVVLRGDVMNRSQISIPTVVRLTALAETTGEEVTSYVVVDSFIRNSRPQTRSTLSRTTMQTPLRTAVLSTSSEITPLTTLTTPATPPTSTTMQSTQSTLKVEGCPVPDNTMVVVLWSVVAVQFMALATMLAYVILVCFKRKKSTTIEPERKEPVGCDPGTIMKTNLNPGEEVAVSDREAVLEIEDETPDCDGNHGQLEEDKRLEENTGQAEEEMEKEKGDAPVEQMAKGFENVDGRKESGTDDASLASPESGQLDSGTRPDRDMSEDDRNATREGTGGEMAMDKVSDKNGDVDNDENGAIDCDENGDENRDENGDENRDENGDENRDENTDRDYDKNGVENRDNDGGMDLAEDMLTEDSKRRNLFEAGNTQDNSCIASITALDAAAPDTEHDVGGFHDSAVPDTDKELTEELEDYKAEYVTTDRPIHKTIEDMGHRSDYLYTVPSQKVHPTGGQRGGFHDRGVGSRYLTPTAQEDFDITLSRMEDSNNFIRHEDTMDTHMNIDSLPDFHLNDVRSRLCVSPTVNVSNIKDAVISPCSPVVPNPMWNSYKPEPDPLIADTGNVYKSSKNNILAPDDSKSDGASASRNRSHKNTSVNRKKAVSSKHDSVVSDDSDESESDDTDDDEKEELVGKQPAGSKSKITHVVYSATPSTSYQSPSQHSQQVTAKEETQDQGRSLHVTKPGEVDEGSCDKTKTGKKKRKKKKTKGGKKKAKSKLKTKKGGNKKSSKAKKYKSQGR